MTLGARKVRALATLHPAYLLRTPAAKRLAWYRRRLAGRPGYDEVRDAVLADEKALGAAVAAR